jgi:5-hydroxyisourate hydrolase
VGRLTTHILDTAQGKPAAGMVFDLYFLAGQSRQHLAQFISNSDGRTDTALLSAAEVQVGSYELLFQVGSYYHQLDLPSPSFLDEVPIRFGIAAITENYHVPLLVSPWSYSTYRGS